jgi:hypothetical protein
MAKRKYSWTAHHDWVLRAYYASEGTKRVARRLEWQRSDCSIRCRAYTLGIQAKRLWEPHEDVLVEILVEAWGPVRTAATLNRTASAVAQRAHKLRRAKNRFPSGIDFLIAAKKMVERLPA